MPGELFRMVKEEKEQGEVLYFCRMITVKIDFLEHMLRKRRILALEAMRPYLPIVNRGLSESILEVASTGRIKESICL